MSDPNDADKLLEEIQAWLNSFETKNHSWFELVSSPDRGGDGRSSIAYDEKTDVPLERYTKQIALGLNDHSTSDALTNRGSFYHTRKQCELAVADFSAAIAMGHSLHVNLWRRSLVHRDMQRHDLELADLQRAVSAVPDPLPVMATDFLADCYARMSVLLRMGQRASTAFASSNALHKVFESQTVSVCHSTSVQQQIIALKSQLSDENRRLTDAAYRLYSDHKYLESVLRCILQTSDGLWFVNEIISLIAGYSMRIVSNVATCTGLNGDFQSICLLPGTAGTAGTVGMGLAAARFDFPAPYVAVGRLASIRSEQEYVRSPVTLRLVTRSDGKICAFPHDSNRVIFASKEKLRVFHLITGETSEIKGGGTAPAIHHDSTFNQHVGMLYLISSGGILQRISFRSKLGLQKVNRKNYPAVTFEHAAGVSDATGMVFDKSTPDSTVLYVAWAWSTITSFDFRTSTCGVCVCRCSLARRHRTPHRDQP